MKFAQILKSISGPLLAVAGASNPLVGGAIATYNAIVSKDKQLPIEATGIDLKMAVDSMPPDQLSSLMEKEVDLKIAQEEGWTERYIAMTKSDSQDARAKIMKWITLSFVWPYALIGLAAAYSLSMGDTKLEDSWPFVLAYLGVSVSLIKIYFGVIEREQGNRIDGMNGNQTKPLGLGRIFSGK